MCPSCKSTKWNVLPDTAKCPVCGKLFIKGRKNVCPRCSGSSDSSECRCEFCGAVWTGDNKKWMSCPVCGMQRSSDESKFVDVWSGKDIKLKYSDADDLNVLYLWKNNVPETAMYFHDVLKLLKCTVSRLSG